VIPVTGKVYSDHDKLAMINCILSGEEITYGSWNERFEKEFAEYTGINYAYFVNSGSSANLLAFMTFTSPRMCPEWRVLPGDEIITVAAGFPTTIAPIVQYGAVPVFVDIEDGTYNIDTTQLEAALSEKTKGIFIAHTLGNPFNVDAVVKFCAKHGLFLIEDNADSLGSEWDGKRTGSFGTVSTCSFYPAHHISTGQGGMVCTDNPVIGKIIASLRGWGKDCICPPNIDNLCKKRFNQKWGELPEGYDHKYVFSHFGYNLQGTNVFAALGCSQLARIQEFTAQRKFNFNTLRDELSPEYEDFLPQEFKEADPSWFGFPILLPEGWDRHIITEKIERAGVATRTLFAGNILKQPCFTENPDIKYRQIGDLPVTNEVMNQLFWVGCHHGLVENDMLYIGKTLKEVL
jgi:CDP-4-dehydro-6-deoxyglucose reductase, E1